MNFRRFLTRITRLNLTAAAREAAALKAEFRWEDAKLSAEGRSAEVWADRTKNLGGDVNSRAELLTIKAFESGGSGTFPPDYRLICVVKETPVVVGGQARGLWTISYSVRSIDHIAALDRQLTRD